MFMSVEGEGMRPGSRGGCAQRSTGGKGSNGNELWVESSAPTVSVEGEGVRPGGGAGCAQRGTGGG